MPSLMKFDQLNRMITELETKLKSNQYTDTFGIKRFKINKDEFCDEVLDLLIMSYAFGNQDANEDLGTSTEVNVSKMQTSIYTKIEGKDWKERIADYLDKGGSTDDIVKVVRTESHRNVNCGGYDTAVDVSNGITGEDTDDISVEGTSNSAVNGKNAKGTTKVYKTWQCMMLPQSRDTHMYLSGTKVGINDKFYTFMGNSTLYPGQFGVPEEDINCMCKLKFSRESSKE